VTAYPVILVDSGGGGSETTASGAGPATALTGTAATTGASGLVVTLDGSPDLSGVNTDGSHVLYYHDTTAGARRFAAINAKDDGADTVTVEQALATSHAASTWGIGGERLAAIGGTAELLWDNNGSVGDAMPGWTVEMQSGHTEGRTTDLDFRREGTASLRITLRGESGAATRPKLSYNTGGGDVHFFEVHGDYIDLVDYDFEVTTSGKWWGMGMLGIRIRAIGLNCVGTGSNVFDYPIYTSGAQCAVRDCYISGADIGGVFAQNWAVVAGCFIKDTDESGIRVEWDNCVIANNIIVDIGTTTSHHGILGDSGGSTQYSTWIVGNTIDNCEGDGVNIPTNENSIAMYCLWNNNISNCSGYGVRFTDPDVTVEHFLSNGVRMFTNNNTYNTISGLGDYKLGTESVADSNAACEIGDSHLNPGYTSAGSPNYNYTVGTALKASKYPGTFLEKTNNIGYGEVGALQREEPAAGQNATDSTSISF
jgi:hypothetical protein